MSENAPEPEPDPLKVPHGDLSIAEVKIDDFKKALRDPKVGKFLDEAQAQGEELEREGRIHY